MLMKAVQMDESVALSVLSMYTEMTGVDLDTAEVFGMEAKCDNCYLNEYFLVSLLQIQLITFDIKFNSNSHYELRF